MEHKKPSPKQKNESYISNSTFHERRGFTLIELIIGVGLTAAIIYVVGMIGNQFSVIGNFLNQKLQNRTDVERAYQIITSRIRQAGPSATGAYAIESAAPASFVFFSDIDGDGVRERVRYFLATSTAATSTITEGVVKASGNPIAYPSSTEVVNPMIINSLSTSTIFRYYDQTYTGTQSPLASPIDVSRITEVSMQTWVDINPGQSPTPTYFTGTVNIRSLKNN